VVNYRRTLQKKVVQQINWLKKISNYFNKEYIDNCIFNKYWTNNNELNF